MGRSARVKRERQPDRAVRLINQLSHTKGPFAGESFNLRPWQAKIVRKLFTTRRDGLRQYRTCLLMLPRKNGKSELAAALAIYFLLFDGEIGAEVYSAAADKDQAALVFNVAAQMIRNDPELEAQCEIVDSQSGSCTGRAAASTGRSRRKPTASTGSMRRSSFTTSSTPRRTASSGMFSRRHKVPGRSP
jgi:phage terminase large subunit-like protein